MKKEPRFPHKLLITGIVLILMGIIVLFWTLGFFPGFFAWLISLWPILLILSGLFFLYFVYLKGKTDRLLLPGMFLLLTGVFFLLYNTIIPEKSLEKIWPAFMDVAGLALIPYALKKRPRVKISLLISSFTLIVLSILFFPFSLKLIKEDFLTFAIRWWPAILILIGVILIISYYSNRHLKAKAPKNSCPPKDKEHL